MTILFILFLISFFISLGVSLIVIYLSHKKNFFIDCEKEDKPQKFHTVPVPRAGGIGIMMAFILFFLTSFGIKVFLPSFLAFLSGIFEDFHNSLSARTRLLMQIIAAISAVYLANTIISYLGLGISLPYWIAILFSVFAIVGMTNAINIIDGFNGLASGVVILILSSLLTIAFNNNDIEIIKVLSIVLGATLGVFVLVFPKGKIFLGDGGAYLLGFIIAILGIYLTNKYNNVSPWYILAICIYPVWEVLFSIIRKTMIGKSPMQPDKYHFHMLVYRVLTKNNPFTAILILFFILPFMVYSTLNFHCSMCNIYIIILFIIIYIIFYFILYKLDKIKNKT